MVGAGAGAFVWVEPRKFTSEMEGEIEGGDLICDSLSLLACQEFTDQFPLEPNFAMGKFRVAIGGVGKGDLTCTGPLVLTSGIEGIMDSSCATYLVVRELLLLFSSASKFGGELTTTAGDLKCWDT